MVASEIAVAADVLLLLQEFTWFTKSVQLTSSPQRRSLLYWPEVGRGDAGGRGGSQ